MRTQNYIKNRGSTQTIINNDSGKPSFNNINWSADYDGNEANIDLDINNNGNDTIIKTRLDNNDLAQLLRVLDEAVQCKNGKLKLSDREEIAFQELRNQCEEFISLSDEVVLVDEIEENEEE